MKHLTQKDVSNIIALGREARDIVLATSIVAETAGKPVEAVFFVMGIGPIKAFQQLENDLSDIQFCRGCGCHEEDCRQCIKKTGKPCDWVEEDLCSACAAEQNANITKAMSVRKRRKA